MPQVLYEDAWITLSFDEPRGLVRYTRNDVPYGDATNLDRSFAGVGKVAAQVPRGSKLLIDIRNAPPRNDAAFETKTNAALGSFLGRFVRNATLVRSAVGKLQTARLARERGTQAHTFEDEAEALAYLDGE
jgi:hypothetical protein